MNIPKNQELICDLGWSAQALDGKPILGWLMSDTGVAVQLVDGLLEAQQSGDALYLGLRTQEGFLPLDKRNARRIRKDSIGFLYFESPIFDYSFVERLQGDDIGVAGLVGETGVLTHLVSARINQPRGIGDFYLPKSEGPGIATKTVALRRSRENIPIYSVKYYGTWEWDCYEFRLHP